MMIVMMIMMIMLITMLVSMLPPAGRSVGRSVGRSDGRSVGHLLPLDVIRARDRMSSCGWTGMPVKLAMRCSMRATMGSARAVCSNDPPTSLRFVT